MKTKKYALIYADTNDCMYDSLSCRFFGTKKEARKVMSKEYAEVKNDLRSSWEGLSDYEYGITKDKAYFFGGEVEYGWCIQKVD